MQTKKWKINKNGIIPGMITIILCLFSITSTLIRYIIPYDKMRLLLILGCLGIEIFLILNANWTKNSFLVLLQIILLASFPVFAMYNNTWGIANTSYYMCALFMIMLCLNGIWNINLSFKIMYIAYALYGICTILFYFTPNFYKNTIVNIFPDEKFRLIQTYNSGCMPGLTSHYSTNGMFLAIGLLISCSKMIANNDEKKKWLYNIQAVFFLIALLLTGKRAHLLFSVFGIYVVYSIVTFVRDKHRFNAFFKILGIILIIGIIGVIVLSVFPALAIVFARLQQYGNIDSGRFFIWQQAWNEFENNPVLGIGWKSFASTYYGFFSKDKIYDVHNVYIQLLCETGIIGFSIYILWFGNLLKGSIHQMKCLISNDYVSEQEKFWSIFAVGYQIFFLLYCITGNPLYDKMTFFPYFFSCGIVFYFDRRYSNLIKKNSIKK